MAELLTTKKGDQLWALKKKDYPGITDLHVHVHSNGMTITAVYKGHKEHLPLDKRTYVHEFSQHLSYLYRKLKQKYG